MAEGAREPVFNLPGIVLAMLGLLIAIHALREYGLSGTEDSYLLQALAFVPGQFTFAIDPDAVAQELTRLAEEGDRQRLMIAQFLLGTGRPKFWTPLTYAFLHADWTHLTVNGLWLAAFGSPVARRFGAGRFLALFAVTSLAGALAHYLTRPVDLVPVIGASAAVSGLTAAALRFIFQPGGPLGGRSWRGPLSPNDAARQPALSLGAAVRDRWVIQFAAIWFAINLAVGFLAVPLGISEYGVAWEAHIGGFVAGFLLFSLFDPPQRGITSGTGY
ncbi:MAG: rhomboid family intramembrane serine protease [Beijerinckiaceae bacterium]|nr:rhomboid family intramembrane serine protease [Beijerinckiaceae bacterium]